MPRSAFVYIPELLFLRGVKAPILAPFIQSFSDSADTKTATLTDRKKRSLAGYPARDLSICYENLFQFRSCAGFFQLSNHAFGFFLGNSFFDCLGSAVNHFFGFLEAKACQLADNLDHFDLLSADIL